MRQQTTRSTRLAAIAALTCLGLAPAGIARGVDGATDNEGGEGGGGGSAPPSYYQSVVDGGETATAAPGVPTLLALDDADAEATYTLLASGGGVAEWRVEIEGYERRAETVDALYDMIVVLPLPADGAGNAAFTAAPGGIPVLDSGGQPFLYAGKPQVLRRNHALEKSLLAGLVGQPGQPGKLPDLSGTGYRYTMWDTIVPWDGAAGSSVQAAGALEYETDASVAAPDPADVRFAAYVVTWIPSLSAAVAPYAVRVDVK